ncbi:Myelin regulatory factor-like protein [Liparis tanakae]|uniref:Myelin regulatory factor-like protein n=1 Tax=Liparis tanakae TaxID=230148 RepID=A0A4Z2G456_9TELE|nr:Myelin regulatory factor-like protein [Liparis tanakae]
MEAVCSEADGTQGDGGENGGGGLGSYQLLTWEHYRLEHWITSYDGSYQTMGPPAYHVDTDKGFNYSAADEAFVCQKKNHFQVTVHIGVATEPAYVRTPGGPRAVDHFQIQVFGVKLKCGGGRPVVPLVTPVRLSSQLESPGHQVTIEQSQPNRSKKPFNPVRVSLPSGKITKVTLGRLHFSETTSNNMRKKGKPNPDQRYFQMVVGLYAAVGGAETVLLTALVSERIIVRIKDQDLDGSSVNLRREITNEAGGKRQEAGGRRQEAGGRRQEAGPGSRQINLRHNDFTRHVDLQASNPGQFEMDGDALWQRGALQDAVVCQGRVGINTDSPDEALVVCGNAKVMGAVMQPSDRRAKENIQEVRHVAGVAGSIPLELFADEVFPQADSEQQLKRITQMRIVEFDYKPEFASTMGIDHTHQTGIIAQEVKELLPSAVTEVGDVSCSDGEKIPHFLMVDKEQIFMENVGAVQQLSKLTDNLETRINELEVWNCRLAKLKSLTGSLRSTGTARTASSGSAPPGPAAGKTDAQKPGWSRRYKVLRAGVFTVVTTLAFCVIFITALYLLTLREKDVDDNRGKDRLNEKLKSARDWTNTSIHSFRIRENQQLIDSRYCVSDHCGPGRYTYRVPISPFVPVNMRVTLLMKENMNGLFTSLVFITARITFAPQWP